MKTYCFGLARAGTYTFSYYSQTYKEHTCFWLAANLQWTYLISTKSCRGKYRILVIGIVTSLWPLMSVRFTSILLSERLFAYTYHTWFWLVADQQPRKGRPGKRRRTGKHLPMRHGRCQGRERPGRWLRRPGRWRRRPDRWRRKLGRCRRRRPGQKRRSVLELEIHGRRGPARSPIHYYTLMLLFFFAFHLLADLAMGIMSK